MSEVYSYKLYFYAEDGDSYVTVPNADPKAPSNKVSAAMDSIVTSNALLLSTGMLKGKESAYLETKSTETYYI